MASVHPLKTLVWVDASQVRRVLINEVFKTAGLEAFTFADAKELSSEVLKSLAPSLIVIHSDFKDLIFSELFQDYRKNLIILGEMVEDLHHLSLPIKPLEIVDQLKDFL